MTTKRPAPRTAFKPGQSGNPGGKPVNARNRVTTLFLESLATDFAANGKTAIEDARKMDPMGYVRVVAGLLPKEFVVEKPLEGLSDEELVAAISDLRQRLTDLATPGQSAEVEPASAADAAAAPASTVRH